MKGIVFNLLEDVVSEVHGPGTWDEVLDVSGLDGVYTALGNYPDEDLFRLVGAISRRLGAPGDQVVRAFGRKALPLLASRYPVFFVDHTSTKPFLLTLDTTIHREVVKLYPGAQPPRFTFEDPSPDRLVMRYVSARRLCSFAEGMIEGAADHYGEQVSLEHPLCLKQGDDHCTLVVTFDARER